MTTLSIDLASGQAREFGNNGNQPVTHQVMFASGGMVTIRLQPGDGYTLTGDGRSVEIEVIANES